MKPIFCCLALALVCACSKSNDTYASPSTTSTKPANTTSIPAHPNATNTSNEKSDIDLQARVRKAIVDDSTLSTAAKNVVIVVKNAAVTLRGTVPTADEKTRITTLATNVAGVTNVDNQIEVKP
jgi:osmotically-inducible protein OsmY